MIWWVLFVLSIAPADGAPLVSGPAAAAMPVRSVGWVERSVSGNLTITYDANPAKPVTVSTKDPKYQQYLEMVGNVRPGTRSRFLAFVAAYDANASGFLIYGWATAPGTVTERGTETVNPGVPGYDCYYKVLSSKGPGRHYLSFREAEEIGRCIERSARRK